MSLGAIGPQFKGEEQQQKGSFLTSALATIASGGAGYAAGGHFFKDEIFAEKVAGLAKDKFESTFSNVPQDKKTIVDNISEIIKSLTPEQITTEAKKYTNNEDSISVTDFLKNLFGKEVSVEVLNHEIEESSGKTGSLLETLKKAEEDFGKAPNDKNFETLVQNAKANIDEHMTNLNGMEWARAVTGEAKDGTISLETLKEAVKYKTFGKINEHLSLLGENIPKVFSIRHATIGALVGMGLLAAGGILFGGHKKENA